MRRSKLELLCVALGSALLVVLVVQEIPRILFPWDLRMFSESALLTDMMKMTAGHGPYMRPPDQNSFIYAPGLEYLTFGLLRPFGAQLDIRACRVVTVLVGLLAGAVAGRVALRFAASIDPVPRRRAVWTVAAIAAALVVFKSYTADSCHPDNLYILHAMLTIALCEAAIDSGTFRAAAIAVVVASLGVAIKQTALPGAGGALAVVLWFGWRRFGVARSAALCAAAALSVGAAAWLVFHGDGRFWALEVPGHQKLELERIHVLVSHVMSVPYRLFFFVGFAPSVLYLAMRTGDRAKAVLGAWLVVGATEVLPSLAGYFKVLGWWNNLTIIDLWAALPTMGVLLHLAMRADGERPLPVRAAAGGALLTVLVVLLPTRGVPTHGQFELGRAMDDAVGRDVHDGKKVLVSIGTMTLLRAGVRDAPLDRASSMGERVFAGLTDFSETNARMASRYYDRIYILGNEAPGYPPEVQSVIDANYHETRYIDADGMSPVSEDLLGVQGLMRGGVHILEKNP